jgi:hypothetical protein
VQADLNRARSETGPSRGWETAGKGLNRARSETGPSRGWETASKGLNRARSETGPSRGWETAGKGLNRARSETGPSGATPAPAGTALDYLIRFIEARPALARGYPVTLVAGNVPVALPPRIVTDGLMLVGDAARQVDPLTGGGIINAMTAGRLAANVAVAAIAAGDTSAGFLSRYEEEWQATVGHKMQRNYRLREKFPPQQRADERFVRAFALAVK